MPYVRCDQQLVAGLFRSVRAALIFVVVGLEKNWRHRHAEKASLVGDVLINELNWFVRTLAEKRLLK